MKFVLATQNPKKLKEMSAILGELGVEVVSEADLGVKIEVEETGETFAENSLLKAKAVMEATKLPAIADDSGLCVDALNGGPGVYSARFGGEGLDDIGRYRLLLQMMHGQADRRAHFHTTITCAFPNGDILQNDGEVEGTIAFAPMGVFLPAVFRWQRSIFFFTATLTLAITAVEVAQVYTGTGSCDIDDLILNLAGALIVYIICRITPLWKRICSVTPRPKKE